jgi:hypothetical protein
MKVEAVIGFKPEAIKVPCEVCQDRIHALKPGLDGDGEKGDGEDEEDHEYLQCLWFQRGRSSLCVSALLKVESSIQLIDAVWSLQCSRRESTDRI